MSPRFAYCLSPRHSLPRTYGLDTKFPLASNQGRTISNLKYYYEFRKNIRTSSSWTKNSENNNYVTSRLIIPSKNDIVNSPKLLTRSARTGFKHSSSCSIYQPSASHLPIFSSIRHVLDNFKRDFCCYSAFNIFSSSQPGFPSQIAPGSNCKHLGPSARIRNKRYI